MLEMDWTVWNKEVSLIFPKLAKCDFYQFGHSGTIERHDVLCLLPQNIINEKIFTFIYFWYIILMLLCVYKMVILMLLIVSKDRRLSSVRQMTHSMTSNFTAEVVTKKGTIGLWFILRQISLNLNTVLLNDLIAEMNEQLRGVSYKSNRESQEL